MSFEAVVPTGGYSGWKFLTRTLAAQQSAFSSSPTQISDREYFVEHIGKVRTAEDVTNDFRLLRVALGAFGLDGDLQNRFFVRMVLEGGVASPDALANKLSDQRYRAFSEAFGFGGQGAPRTGQEGFADEILSAYSERQFEISVGEKNGNFRLALNAERELKRIASGTLSDDGKWYAVMGSAPLRSVFETAFGLPETFSSLDLGEQLEVFRNKSTGYLGDSEVSQFSEPDGIDKLVRRFLLQAEVRSVPTGLSPEIIALTILGAS